MRWTPALLFAVAAAVSACTPSDGDGTVAEGNTVWAVLTEEPIVELGADPTDPDQQFDGITGLVRMTDGRIAVADRSLQVRFFDPEGELLAVRGRRGSGPGEFEMIAWLKPYRGDSLLLWDPRLNRATVLDGRGEFGRTLRIEADRRFPPIVLLEDRFSDGSLLAMAGPPNVEERETGRWAVLPLLHVSAAGEVSDAISDVPLHVCEAGEDDCAAQYKEYRAVWTAGGDGLHYARPDRWEILALDLDGREVARTRGPPAEARRRGETDGTGDVPAYTDLLLDPDGRLWAKAGGEGDTWFVFDRSGEYAGRVEMPEGLEVHQVGADFVLGVERDDFDVEQVKLYGLQSARASG